MREISFGWTTTQYSKMMTDWRICPDCRRFFLALNPDSVLRQDVHRSIRLRLPAPPQSPLFALSEQGQDSVRVSRLVKACWAMDAQAGTRSCCSCCRESCYCGSPSGSSSHCCSNSRPEEPGSSFFRTEPSIFVSRFDEKRKSLLFWQIRSGVQHAVPVVFQSNDPAHIFFRILWIFL